MFLHCFSAVFGTKDQLVYCTCKDGRSDCQSIAARCIFSRKMNLKAEKHSVLFNFESIKLTFFQSHHTESLQEQLEARKRELITEANTKECEALVKQLHENLLFNPFESNLW